MNRIKKVRLCVVICLVILLIGLLYWGRKKIYFEYTLNKAFYYESRQQNSKAIEEYNKLIDLRSDLFELYINRAILEFQSNEKEASEKDFLHALELNPNEPSIYYNLAHFYSEDDTTLSEYYLNIGIEKEFQRNMEGNNTP